MSAEPDLVFLAAYVVAPNDGNYQLGDCDISGRSAFKCFDGWSIRWAREDWQSSEHKRLRSVLNLSEEKVEAIRSWSDDEFGKSVEWPNIFTSIESAKAYRKQFFGGIRDLRVLSLSCRKEDCAELLETVRPGSGYEGWSGLAKAARDCRSMPHAADNLYVGYEVLGMEAGSSLHSLNCFDIWKRPEVTSLGIAANGNGHLLTWDDALRLEGVVNAIDGGLDGIPWFSFRIAEH